ncbi:MAG: hypothetical protein R3C03_04480 [Pirellulaceae bacterium]
MLLMGGVVGTLGLVGGLIWWLGKSGSRRELADLDETHEKMSPDARE